MPSSGRYYSRSRSRSIAKHSRSPSRSISPRNKSRKRSYSRSSSRKRSSLTRREKRQSRSRSPKTGNTMSKKNYSPRERPYGSKRDSRSSSKSCSRRTPVRRSTSRSSSRSPKRHKVSSRRSRSYSPRDRITRNNRSNRRSSRSSSPSPRKCSDQKRHIGRSEVGQRDRTCSRSPSSCKWRPNDRDHPLESHVLGVFGMSFNTTERTLEKEFGRYGPLEKVQLIKDGKDGRSRGFAFVYFEELEDAKTARNAMCREEKELDGKRIRIDYSITKRGHHPTPGGYMGRPSQSFRERKNYDGHNSYGFGGRAGGGYTGGWERSASPRSGRGDRYEESRRRSRSYSPRRY